MRSLLMFKQGCIDLLVSQLTSLNLSYIDT